MSSRPSFWEAVKYCMKYLWERPWKHCIMSFVLFVCAFFVEMVVFNYKHWTSLFNHPLLVESTLGSGYESLGDGEYKVIEGDHNIWIRNINGKVKNLKLEFVDIDKEYYDEGSIISAEINGTDVSHANFYYLGRRMIVSNEERSFYITPHFYGDTKDIFITLYPENGHHVRIDIELNTKIPIFFMLERFVLVWALMLVCYFFKPGAVLSQIEYLSVKPFARAVIVVSVMVVNFVIFKNINELNWMYQGEYGINTEQYVNLAKAFSEGSLFLLDEPCETLVNMENPYDPSERNRIMEFGEWYFDHAYYNGHYYVYFGAGPVVCLYLPYYLLTGENMHNHTACLIGLMIIILGIMLLYDRLISIYFKKCSFALWGILCELTVLGSHLVYIDKRPDLYSVPITFAIAFAIMGMWAFLKALPDGDDMADAPVLKIRWLVLGSLLTAYVVSCRPQIFLIVILDIIVLRKYCFNFKYLRSPNGIKALIAVFVPMLVIGSFIMSYNYLRFGSVFDFGAFYNLTFNDMRYRGFNWDRIPYGIVQYLFNPPKLMPEYPYFGNIDMNTVYMGETIQETTYGGLFFMAPFALVGFAGILYRKYLKNKTLSLLSVASLGIGIFIVMFDTTNAGILARYFFDFSFFFMLSAGLTVMNVMQSTEGVLLKKSLGKILIALIIYEIIYQIFVFMGDSGDYLLGSRKDLLYHLYYLLGFGI